MDECARQRMLLSHQFRALQQMFIALGDQTRQHIFIVLLENQQVGMRVGEITQRPHLSRPAVSHHLHILREAGLIAMRRVGTRNYYYVEADESQWGSLKALVDQVYTVVHKARQAGYPPIPAEG
nr:metalloregulator ArsR/SmtB family transcription factor [bacterium]